MRQLLTLFTISLLSVWQLQAQQHSCNLDNWIQTQLVNNPAFQNELDQLNHDKAIYAQQGNSGNARANREVSVVVHVVYNTAAENVPQAEVNNMIATLNAAYTSTNSNQSSVRQQFQSVIGNPQITFCLDQTLRVSTSKTCFDPNTQADDMKYTNTGGSPAVDPSHYLNIWIVDLCGNTGGGVAGYAYLPTGGVVGSSSDGLVVDYSLGWNSGNGSTAVHEIGHYFGLSHPWGNVGGCSDDDGLSDTPNCSGPTYTCSNSATSCGVTTQVENFMDYTDCNMMFTVQQASVMNGILSGSRASLLSSPGCSNSGPSAPVADFSASSTLVCPGSTVDFTDASTGTPTSWSWTFTGGSPSSSTSQNPSVTYNTPGSYTVSLTATNAQGTDTETKTAYITVQASQNLPLTEGFEGTTFPPSTSWNLENADASTTWARTTQASGYGASTACMYIDNYNYNAAGQYDVLLTPVYDFTGVSNAILTFDYAYGFYGNGQGGQPLADSLLVIVSPDCGANYYLLDNKGGADLATVSGTVTSAFVPTAGQWKTDTIDLSILAGYPSVQFGFANLNGYGNNLYIDNINISTPPVNSAPVADFYGAPTTIPVGGSVNFTDNSTNSPTSWSWTFTGGTPGTATTQNPAGITYNAVGTYPVSLTATNSFGSDTETKTGYINVVNGGSGTCGYITNISQTDTLTLYGTQNGGYLSGHNGYGDLAKMDKFSGILSGSTVDTVLLGFGVVVDGGAAGGSIDVKIWDADGTAGAPNTVLGTTTLQLSQLSTTNITTAVFSPAVTLNGDFYAGIEFTYNGDTVALITNQDGDMAAGTGTGWEKWSDGTFHAYNETGNWELDLAHYIIVNVCEPGSSNPVTADFSASSTSICAGETVNFTNLSSNASSYAWTFTGGSPNNSSQTAPAVSYNTPGTYAVTLVASGSGGSDTETKTGYITVLSPPSISSNQTSDVSCNGGNDGSIDITVTGGQSPYTYLWTNSATTQDISNLTAGSYNVTVTDAAGCTAAASVQLTQPTAIVATVTTTQATCGAANGTATASAGGGVPPYTYSWASQTGATASGLLPGPYVVTVTDGSGCTTTAQGIVTGSSSVSLSVSGTNASCGATNGTATATASGGSIPYTYNWSNNQSGATISNLSGGTYTVTVTDGGGCSATDSVTITGGTSFTLSFTKTDANCNTSDGSATVTPNGGAGPYTYLWSNSATTSSITNLAAGTYTVTVSDGGGCSVTDNVAINNIGGPSVSISSITDVSCNGGNNGAVTASASGGTGSLTYTWTGNRSGASITGLTAGNYSVTVTDQGGCVATTTAVVSEPTALTLNSSSTTNVSCNGGSDGAATVAASGGTASYTYAWSGGGSGATKSGLAAGSYGVTVTDAHNCTASTTVTITEPAVLSATANGTNPGCSSANGTATASVSGGTTPYSYSWTGGATSNPATGLASGSYTVTITDANGCSTTASTTLTASSGPSLGTSSTPVSCGATNDGSATAQPSGGSTPYTYAWTNSVGASAGSTQTISNLTAGTYNVTVTDAQGCTATSTATVTSVGPQITSNITDVTGCYNSNNGAISLGISGGQAPYTYTWSNSASTKDISALTAGSYTVTVADVGGCVSTLTFTVGGPDQVAPNLSTTDATTSTSNDGAASVSPTGGTGAYTVNWSTGATGNSISGLAPGNYSVAVSDANNCTETQNFTIGVTSGIVDVTELVGLNIYPNPNEGRFTLDVEMNRADDLRVEIYNTIGLIVYEKDLDHVLNTSVQLDLTELPSAAYYVKVSSSEFSEIRKVLKINQ